MAGFALLARLRSSRGRRLLIAFFAVPAILIGLVAMHVLTTTGLSDSSVPVAMTPHHVSTASLVSEQSVAVSPAMPASVEDCGVLCGPSHDMLGMICMSALLVTVILLTLHLVLIRWQELRQVITDLTAKLATLAPQIPPSLHILSINRT